MTTFLKSVIPDLDQDEAVCVTVESLGGCVGVRRKQVTDREKPPPSVYVYWCKNCGDPVFSALESTPEGLYDCPWCPLGQGGYIGEARYILAPEVEETR